jgi:hypothetical protein
MVGKASAVSGQILAVPAAAMRHWVRATWRHVAGSGVVRILHAGITVSGGLRLSSSALIYKDMDISLASTRPLALSDVQLLDWVPSLERRETSTAARTTNGQP